MKPDKGRGVIIMHRSKYHENRLLLGTNNFKMLDYDPTKKAAEKIRKTLQKMKNKLSK